MDATREKRTKMKTATRTRLIRTNEQLRHITDLAALALTGNEPEGGLDYLADALDLLRTELSTKRATAAGITPAQRERLRTTISSRVGLLKHRVALIENDMQCPDPESALQTLRSLGRECDRLLAAAAC